MNPTEKVAALQAIYEQIDNLMSADEMSLYPVLQHLEDWIADLELEA
jgi:hypothetical protein